VLRPEEFARHVTLARLACADALGPWVENYWTVRWDLPPGRSFLSATLPHPSHNLTVERGVAREGATVPVVVTGVVTRRFEVVAEGQGWTFGAKFRPGGLAALTGLHARELRDRTLPARELLPAHVVDTLDELGPADADAQCAERFDEVLKELATAPDPAYEAVLDVVATMLQDRTLLRVADVETRCGIGERSLQRLFARYVGVSPKWVLARYRMHDAVAELDAGYAGALADLAARYGWFDQAHFTRAFTRLVGEPPSAYQRRALEPHR
jgi:AraC-like DNA-binding protein